MNDKVITCTYLFVVHIQWDVSKSKVKKMTKTDGFVNGVNMFKTADM